MLTCTRGQSGVAEIQASVGFHDRAAVLTLVAVCLSRRR